MIHSVTMIATFLIGLLLLTACSRLPAYFQLRPPETFVTKAPATAADVSLTPPRASKQPLRSSLIQAATSLDPLEALVSREGKLAPNKSLQQRLSQVPIALVQGSVNATWATPAAPLGLTLLERVMVKKLNKTISKQLAPDQSQKTIASKGDFLARAILVLLSGLLLLLITAGARP